MGQTMIEKIFSRHNLLGTPVKAGDLIDARLDGAMVTTLWGRMRKEFQKIGFDGPPTVWDPERVYLLLEHNQPPRSLNAARSQYECKQDAIRLGLKHFYDSEMGICHQMMFDYGHVRPGELIVGNDSHTIIYGALNAASSSIGNETIPFAITFGELWFTVPETIRITLKGKHPGLPFAKDIMLYMAGKYSDSFALMQAIEYAGPLAHDMTLADRMTLSDHGVEVGAQFAMFSADEKTHEYVKARSDIEFEPVEADADATYAREIEIDADEIGFQVAKPWNFDNVVPVKEVAGIKIDQARVGSCANGRLEDMEIVARIVKGRKVAPG